MKTPYLLVVLCILSWGLISCESRKLQREIERFTEKEIVVPVEMRQMVGVLDSVALNPAIEMPRLVVYVDSIACSSCRLKIMYEYAEIIDHSKESGEGFVPIFVFSPPPAKVGEMIQTLETTQFNYPVFIDETGAFPAANPHIPADSRFHTFLLDKNGKVVLVGDPVNNPQLWDLYKTTIMELIANGGTMPVVEN